MAADADRIGTTAGKRRWTRAADRTSRALLACALAAAALAAGCARSPLADNPPPPRPEEGARAVDLRSARIDARVGEVFEVRLPNAPGNGYRWDLADPVPPNVRALGVSRGEPARGDLIGAPAQEVWRFEGGPPGTGSLSFVYRRITDAGGAPPAQRVSFRVEIR